MYLCLVPVLPQRHRNRCTWAWPGGRPTLDSRSRCGMALLDNCRKSRWSTTGSGTCGARCAYNGTRMQANAGGRISNTYNGICCHVSWRRAGHFSPQQHHTNIREATRSCQVAVSFKVSKKNILQLLRRKALQVRICPATAVFVSALVCVFAATIAAQRGATGRHRLRENKAIASCCRTHLRRSSYSN